MQKGGTIDSWYQNYYIPSKLTLTMLIECISSCHACPNILLCLLVFIAWIGAVRHRTAVPHSTYHLLCMLEWSLSGHYSVCINHSAHNFKGWLRKTLNKRHFYLYQYLSYILHSSLKPARISLLILVVPFNLYFEKKMKKNEKKCCWYCDPFQRQEVSGNKANTS